MSDQSPEQPEDESLIQERLLESAGNIALALSQRDVDRWSLFTDLFRNYVEPMDALIQSGDGGRGKRFVASLMLFRCIDYLTGPVDATPTQQNQEARDYRAAKKKADELKAGLSAKERPVRRRRIVPGS